MSNRDPTNPSACHEPRCTCPDLTVSPFHTAAQTRGVAILEKSGSLPELEINADKSHTNRQNKGSETTVSIGAEKRWTNLIKSVGQLGSEGNREVESAEDIGPDGPPHLVPDVPATWGPWGHASPTSAGQGRPWEAGTGGAEALGLPGDRCVSGHLRGSLCPVPTLSAGLWSHPWRQAWEKGRGGHETQGCRCPECPLRLQGL